MNILIVFATFSSGTQTAVSSVASLLTEKGHTVTTQRVGDTKIENFDEANLIMFASPSWDFEGKEGQPHPDFITFMQTVAGKTTPHKKYAVFGLGDSTYANFCGAVDHLEELVKNLQGTLVTDSLRVDGFYFNQEKNLQIIHDWVTTLNNKIQQT